MSTPPDRQAPIDQYFDEFINNDPGEESLDEMIEALDAVIYKALLEKLGYTESGDEQKNLVRQKMNEYMINMDFNNPSLAHSEKMLHSIGAKDYIKAANYLEHLYKIRTAAISQKQKQIAQQPRKKDPFAEILVRLVRQKDDISYEETIERLESGLYGDVIVGFDEYDIYYTLPTGMEKVVSKANIPSRLARLRNKK